MTAAAVIIGCWEEHSQPIHQQIYQNIIDDINNNHNIKTVILSSCHVSIDTNNQGNNLWFDHEKEIFLDNQGVNWIRELWKRAQIDNQAAKFANVNQLILHHRWDDKFCISLSEQWQIEYLLNNVLDSTTEIRYYGIGWNFGVQRDPIGWGQLCNLIKFKHIRNPIDILVNRNCVAVNADHGSGKHYSKCRFEYPDFSKSDWQQIEHNTYIKKTPEWDYCNLADFVPVDQ
jgi:hypothetical protein